MKIQTGKPLKIHMAEFDDVLRCQAWRADRFGLVNITVPDGVSVELQEMKMRKWKRVSREKPPDTTTYDVTIEEDGIRHKLMGQYYVSDGTWVVWGHPDCEVIAWDFLNDPYMGEA